MRAKPLLDGAAKEADSVTQCLTWGVEGQEWRDGAATAAQLRRGGTWLDGEGPASKLKANVVALHKIMGATLSTTGLVHFGTMG